jgi:AraC-like DNA-binding protein
MNKLDNFISAKPTLELQKYIDSYYFHSCDNSKSNIKFTYYPNIKHAITIYKDSVAKTQGDLTIINPKKLNNSVLYSTVRKNPHNVEIKGKFKKIGIVFKPYGVNHFIKKDIKEFNNGVISVFEEWNCKIQNITEEIWETDDIKSRITIMDSFLKIQMTNNINEQFSVFINEITKSKNIESIQDIVKKYYPNRKARYRIFRRELNCSPSTYLKILRFRKSLESSLSTNKINLTQVALAQFYDQSDFIKNVKQITHTTPKRLTKQVSDLDNSIFWKIE